MSSRNPERDGPTTLRAFFLGPPSDWQARFIKTTESQHNTSDVGRATGLADVDRRVMTNTVAEKLKDALNVSINQILLSAWSQHRDLANDLERSMQQRGETILVPLADHTIRSTHHPSVEVMVNDRRVAAFKFNANLMMRIQQAVLKVEGGEVVGAESGAWHGVGQLKCGPVTLVEHESKEFALPKTLSPQPEKPGSKPKARAKAEPDSRTGFRTPHWQRPT
ncbi:MAG: hypothetical protein OEU92_26295 [Alphaproteobacteria bacterium]|nr:hypothetical protein [Alphaproteobacteria bacterium]